LPSVPTSRATRVTSSAKDGRADAAELAAQRPAVDLQVHRLREIAVGDGVDDARNLGRRPDEVVDHPVDRVGRLSPRAAVARQRDTLVEAAFANDVRDAL
jgi:hypothetical protein